MDLEKLLTLRNLVLLTGLLHFCQIPAMVMAPRMLGWKEDLAKLSLINQRIVKVIGLAIVIAVVGLGVVVAYAPSDMVSHSRLALALSGFLTVFWAYRALVQFALYMRIWVKGWLGTLSNYGLAFLFTYLTVVYGVLFVYNLRS